MYYCDVHHKRYKSYYVNTYLWDENLKKLGRRSQILLIAKKNEY